MVNARIVNAYRRQPGHRWDLNARFAALDEVDSLDRMRVTLVALTGTHIISSTRTLSFSRRSRYLQMET